MKLDFDLDIPCFWDGPFDYKGKKVPLRETDGQVAFGKLLSGIYRVDDKIFGCTFYVYIDENGKTDFFIDNCDATGESYWMTEKNPKWPNF